MFHELDRSRPQLWFGIKFGLAMGALFVTFDLVAVLWGATGEALPPGVTHMEQRALYVGAGLVGGAVVGLLFPLARWRIGSIALGILALAPYYLGQYWLVEELEMQLLDPLLGALVVGGIVGFIAHDWSSAFGVEDNGQQ